MVAYGSGAGSDAFDITVTDAIKDFRRQSAYTVAQYLKNTKELDYATYAKFRGKILMKG